MKIQIKNINIGVEQNQEVAIKKYIKEIGIEKESIQKITYLKKSIDSRNRKDIKLIYNIEINLNKKIDISKFKNITQSSEEILVKRKSKNLDGKIAVIGTGPAGLFAALRLCELGYKPIVFERGTMVEERDKDIENFYKLGILNEDSNIQFGEGGAGTYSDGKLTTRVRSQYMDYVFETFVKFGAQEEILYHYKPHIGTDVLKIVVQNMRNQIIEMGGEFKFNSKITDFKIFSNKIKSIEINGKEWLEFNYILLGIGHSARDTYKKLYERGVFMENKDFAVGVRIEHPREDIDKMQFGEFAGHPHLGSATYNYTYNNTAEKRGVFSFCMCPGGEIVNASSIEGHSLVNGMSYSTRDGKFSNSAVVVAVKKEDFGNDVFDGMNFQEKIERKAFEIKKGHGALYQNLFDFMKNKKTKEKIESSYKMELCSTNFNDFFPEVIKNNMQLAFKEWSRNKYFISERANLIGPETRTSAPIRITRNEKGKSLNVENLFPIGEGAGYAGGIVSAAIDGIKIVDNNFAIEE
ncbi:MAG: NAD(P)/FAD-dependent oxidoreductase [Fusobacteriaceae bacterium]|nr:NAD(P)/FAD-dependent oxidoreductase [Fusobacteriaceae bacterium]